MPNRWNFERFRFLGRLPAIWAVSCLFQGLCAQTSNTPLAGSTPPAIAGGAPANAYTLSDLEAFNLYNGNLNFSIPPIPSHGPR